MKKKIVLGVTGSIAAYKAGDIIRRFQEQNCDVTVVMTKEATEFVTPLTLATLSGKDVYGDMFCASNWNMGHIELSKADVVVVAPATANVIGKMAHGLADDLLTTLLVTTRAPIFLAPAMNDDMYANAIVQENCAKLKKHGVRFIEPTKGKLACGVVGVGHLADVQDIVKTVLKKIS
ncbi:MAG: phosphopantothenoylcysteine decarboxylase [Candidatus Omnitrophica bacterium]|nr:phosphopantothenoylcysteine decarboxylase [Candidatus Omnitrophota bacterium]